MVADAQVRWTATPISANLVSPTPLGLQQSAPTLTFTPSATPPGPTLLEARESAGNVNVRAAPDPTSERLGSIAFGTSYPVLRQYYLWFELKYEPSPSGRAWVYSELVTVTGDQSAIDVIEDFADIFTPSDGNQDLQSSLEGNGQTGNEDSRILEVPATQRAGRQRDERSVAIALPTFTYPSDLPVLAPTGMAEQNDGDEGNTTSNGLSEVPPVLPIMILAGFGMVGLLLNAIRS